MISAIIFVYIFPGIENANIFAKKWIFSYIVRHFCGANINTQPILNKRIERICEWKILLGFLFQSPWQVEWYWSGKTIHLESYYWHDLESTSTRKNILQVARHRHEYCAIGNIQWFWSVTIVLSGGGKLSLAALHLLISHKHIPIRLALKKWFFLGITHE